MSSWGVDGVSFTPGFKATRVRASGLAIRASHFSSGNWSSWPYVDEKDWGSCLSPVSRSVLYRSMIEAWSVGEG
jgi:hypothetical protein